MRGEKTTFGALLQEAWNQYTKCSTAQDANAGNVPLFGGVTALPLANQDVMVHNETSPEESDAVRRLLRILRSGDADTRDAILANLDRFDCLTRLLNPTERFSVGEITTLARSIAADPKRRVELLRDFDSRYRASGRSAGAHEATAKKKP